MINDFKFYFNVVDQYVKIWAQIDLKYIDPKTPTSLDLGIQSTLNKFWQKKIFFDANHD